MVAITVGLAVTPWVYRTQGDGRVLVIVDHASNQVPEEIELGIDRKLLANHIAWDIGAEALEEALGYPVFAATVSRLVVDMNRDRDDPALVPEISDLVEIPGNRDCDRGAREGLWRAYHDAFANIISHNRPKLLVSLHSFTPKLAARPDEARPWEIGILYNDDDRAARVMIPLLEARRIVVGDQLPYSGKILNATMNRHGEGNGIPYLGIEVRQDLIGDAAGVARWAEVLRPVIAACLDAVS